MTDIALKTVDDVVVVGLRHAWEDGWNRGDVAAIMRPFAADVVFSSPFVPKLAGDPATTAIVGSDALQAYVAASLARAPGIRYTVNATYVGTDSIILVYTVHRPDGTDKTGADSLRLDGAGEVVEWRCHYAADFLSPDVRYAIDEGAP